MKTYLNVSYEEKDEAKILGAKWDNIEKKWYAPNSESILIEKYSKFEPINELIGEDRTFGGDELFVDLVPDSCWFKNIRSSISKKDWDRLRKYIYERVDYKCECCGIDGKDAKNNEDNQIEAHERWFYDEDNKIQKLIRLVALCKKCHLTTHMGFSKIIGRDDEMKKHLIKIRKFKKKDCENHIKEAFSLWRERNNYNYKLDLSLIENNNIKIIRPLINDDNN